MTSAIAPSSKSRLTPELAESASADHAAIAPELHPPNRELRHLSGASENSRRERHVAPRAAYEPIAKKIVLVDSPVRRR